MSDDLAKRQQVERLAQLKRRLEAVEAEKKDLEEQIAVAKASVKS